MSLQNEHDLSLAARRSALCQWGHLLSIPLGPPAKILVTRGQDLISLPAQAPASPCFPAPFVSGQCVHGQEYRVARQHSTPSTNPALSSPGKISKGPNHAAEAPGLSQCGAQLLKLFP